MFAGERKTFEYVCRVLSEKLPDRRCRYYHAGMNVDDRTRVEDDFLGNKVDVVCATIAYGLGVDKPDIRTVVHTSLPESVSQYWQQVGRGGHDGNPCRCELMSGLPPVWDNHPSVFALLAYSDKRGFVSRYFGYSERL